MAVDIASQFSDKEMYIMANLHKMEKEISQKLLSRKSP